MENITIPLTNSLKEFFDSEITSGAGHDPAEVIEKLVREERKRRARRKVEAMLDKSLASGEPTEMTPEDWKQLRKRVLGQDASKENAT